MKKINDKMTIIEFVEYLNNQYLIDKINNDTIKQNMAWGVDRHCLQHAFIEMLESINGIEVSRSGSNSILVCVEGVTVFELNLKYLIDKETQFKHSYSKSYKLKSIHINFINSRFTKENTLHEIKCIEFEKTKDVIFKIFKFAYENHIGIIDIQRTIEKYLEYSAKEKDCILLDYYIKERG